MTYPIKIKTTASFLAELNACEYGRWEDADLARRSGDIESIKENEYYVVFCDFGERWKSQIEVRNDDELRELYYALASGTIGLYGCRQANRILDEIRPLAEKIDPDMVDRWPYQDCH